MTDPRLRPALGVLVLVVGAIVVGMAFVTIPHTGGDNAGYVALAHGLLTEGSYTDAFDPAGLKHTKYPPVFPLLLALLIGLGARTWVALKMTAAVSTVVAIGGTYLWAERRAGPLAGFGVALLLAFSSGIVYYSHWVLSDPVFLGFTMIALAALSRAAGERDHAEEPSTGPGDAAEAGPAAHGVLWLWVGVLATGLAYFTRSAGLPLVLALLGWLAMGRRWRSLAGATAALGLPMLLWWVRGRGEGVAQYGTEFWMVDPYDPSLGRISPLGLVPRIVENGSAYLLQHGPAGIVGSGAPALAPLGITLGVLAVVGWVLSLRRRVGVAELFFPLYTGLILVWPAVWGGDRFALPLYPLVFLYGVVALRAITARLPAAGRSAAGALALLVLLLPAAGNWLDTNRRSAQCEAVAAARGPWACYGPRIGYFVEAATWSAGGLPDGAAVLSRKPRHFYLHSGHPSRAFPFEESSEAHLALADSLGARYVLLDRWDGLAGRYVGAAVTRHPDAFCYVRGFGQPSEGGAQLLGILPPDRRGEARGAGEASVGIESCPADYLRPGAPEPPYSSSGRIPLLEELDS